MLTNFSSGSFDFNSIAVAKKARVLAGSKQVNRINCHNYTPSQNDIVTMCTLAHFSNGIVTPVLTVTSGYSNEVIVGGIYCNGRFIKYSPEFLAEYGLDMEVFSIKRVCVEFNDGSSISCDGFAVNEIGNSTQGQIISERQFVETFTGVVDLTVSYKIIWGLSGNPLGMSFSIISTHNAFAMNDESIYMMPCTVKFKNNVKIIGYFMVDQTSGFAIPVMFMGEKFSTEKKKDLNYICTIKPLIVSPSPDGGVIVSEGMDLKLISLKQLKNFSKH